MDKYSEQHCDGVPGFFAENLQSVLQRLDKEAGLDDFEERLSEAWQTQLRIVVHSCLSCEQLWRHASQERCSRPWISQCPSCENNKVT